MPRLVQKFLIALGSLIFSACSIELQHDLEEDDANDIYVLLTKNGIGASKLKEEGGNEPRYIISVSKQDVTLAAELLKTHSLPRPKADGLGVFKKMKGMIPTQTEERAMFIEAVAGEISNALNRYPGVLEARTIVMIPEVNDLTQPEKKPRPTASVFIKYSKPSGEGETLPFKIVDVQQFVANAVSEMRKEDVTVLATPAADIETIARENMPQTVMGLRFQDKGSADSFKMMVAINAVLFLALAGVAAFLVIRKPGASQRSGRSKTQAE